jgi:NADH dehydrogenase
MKSPHHIVIVGGGAGGIELATHLGKKLYRNPNIRITLVDASFTHLWKPLLHEVAAGTLNSHEDEINYLAHGFTNHYGFCLGKMIGLNRASREIMLAPILSDNHHTKITHQRTLSYDTLIIAVGSITNDFNTPGVKEFCAFLDNRLEADQFHQQFINTIINLQNQSEMQSDDKLNIVIVGGGATGVELAAELNYALQQSTYYGLSNSNLANNTQISIIEAADRILSVLPKRVSESTHKELEKLGVKIYCNEKVMQVTESAFHTQSGLLIPATLKIWAAGIKAPSFLQNLDGLESNRINQLIVGSTLQVTKDENIFAFGDCASCLQIDTGKPVPPRAQAAHQQANLLAKSLVGRLEGKQILHFKYYDYGSLISLSKHTAIGTLMGRLLGSFWLEGKLARLFYISLYRLHQLTLFGFWRGSMLFFANLLSQRVKPRLKLH